MLVEFRVKNFRSFQGEQVLSMVASSNSENSLTDTNRFPIKNLGNRQLLRSAAIYGPNASGKSNLVAAFRFVSRFVRAAIDRQPDDEIPVQPFLLDPLSSNSKSEFELTFIQEGIRYQYGFEVDQERVHAEWLYAYPKSQPQKWLDRRVDTDSGADWALGSGSFGQKLTGEKEQLKSQTRPNVLFLSVAARYNHLQLSKVYSWFSNHLRVVNADSPVLLSDRFTARKSKEDRSFHDRVKALLGAADFGITDFSVEEREVNNDEILPFFSDEFRSQLAKQKQLRVKMSHRANGAPGKDITFSLEDESLGTQRFFAISGPLLDALLNGWTLIVDELDASLHAYLVRALVKLFHDPGINSNNAQLIFNTHDTSLLDSSLFRRDQIWFTDKDEGGASHLYQLLDYSPRQGEALQKNYLQGRYGAVPIIAESLAEPILHGKTQ